MVTSSTLSGNSAESGGGVFNTGLSTVHLRNSILVNSPAGGNCFGNLIRSDGNNLSDTAACFAGGSQGDIVSSTPGLGPLALNAPGTTMTHALLDGSPAIDGVTFNPTDCGTSIARDQRGVIRPQTIFGARCDIGAFERASIVPTIGTIGPKTTFEDTPTPAIPFTVGDDQTPPASLTIHATTSDQSLVPNANVVLGGSGANRTVTVTPAANQNGLVDVTLTVSDGSFTSSTTFTLTVTPVNDAPVNSVPGPQTTTQDAPLVFSSSHGNRISVVDVDAASSPVRVALTATHGTLSLNGTTGLIIESGASGSATVTVAGSLTSLDDALNGLTFTSTPGYTGPAALRVASDDLGNTGSGGARAASDTVAIAVTAVNHPPLAHDDSYSVAAGQTLSVPAASGVLANDSDPDSQTLTSVPESGPAHGSLTLNPNGSLTYTPANGFAGTDSFTYRASDGTAQSQPATVTMTVTPTACLPRPKIQTSPTAGGGRLNVHVEATPLNTAANNPISRLEFGTLQNAKVMLSGQSVVSGQVVNGMTNTFALDFTVERVTPGLATTVPFTVVDVCGSWRTFVGGGTAAGF
ncbi:MAG: Ig-like domain-containing protein [Chloroflexota bacterium]